MISKNSVLQKYLDLYCLKLKVPLKDHFDFKDDSIVRNIFPRSLQKTLNSDPAVEVLLELSNEFIAFGEFEHVPFYIPEPRRIILSPSLVARKNLLIASTRWALEVCRVVNEIPDWSVLDEYVTKYGINILSVVYPNAYAELSELMPEFVSELTVNAETSKRSSDTSILKKIVGYDLPTSPEKKISNLSDFIVEAPLEKILISHGDTRLVLDSKKLNKYGVPPNPRPQAIHFSSSTASPISEYGFKFCEILRRSFVNEIARDADLEAILYSRLGQMICCEILKLAHLDKSQADVVVVPSGTDAEKIAVGLALANMKGSPVTNVIIGSEESGSFVREAAQGNYYDNVVAGKEIYKKGEKIWINSDIKLVEVPIRTLDGAPLEINILMKKIRDIVEEEISADRHVMVHILQTSKTGLSGPTAKDFSDALGELIFKIDVVVDACQMRADFKELGDLIRRGWLVQISGSKFLTGPPFSGAILVPTAYSQRYEKLKPLLEQSPAMNDLAFWDCEYEMKSNNAENKNTLQFGVMFRWIPALIEYQLYDKIPLKDREDLVEAFRVILKKQITKFRSLEIENLLSLDQRSTEKRYEQETIFLLRVLGKTSSGELKYLEEEDYRHMFRLLNEDLSEFFKNSKTIDQAIAKKMVHLGQPVKVTANGKDRTILRIVLGARFFNIIRYSGATDYSPGLFAELSDAMIALEKVDLLANNWFSIKTELIKK